MGRNKKGKKKAVPFEEPDEVVKPALTEDDELRFQNELELALKLSREEEEKRKQELRTQGEAAKVEERAVGTNGTSEKWKFNSVESQDTNSENDFEEVSSRKGKKPRKRNGEVGGGPISSGETTTGNGGTVSEGGSLESLTSGEVED